MKVHIRVCTLMFTQRSHERHWSVYEWSLKFAKCQLKIMHSLQWTLQQRLPKTLHSEVMHVCRLHSCLEITLHQNLYKFSHWKLKLEGYIVVCRSHWVSLFWHKISFPQLVSVASPWSNTWLLLLIVWKKYCYSRLTFLVKVVNHSYVLLRYWPLP